MKGTTHPTCHYAALPVLLGGLLAGGLLSGCATLKGAGGGASGQATEAQLDERTKALAALSTAAMTPCATKGKEEDRGLFVVSAKPDGSVQLGETLWTGTTEMVECIKGEVPKQKLPAWNGPHVATLWVLSAPGKPPFKPLDPPADFVQKEKDLIQKAVAGDREVGPMAACAARAGISQDSFAGARLRYYVFPSGKVVAVSPTGNEMEGKEAAFMECAAELIREWSFAPFSDQTFLVSDVNFTYGIRR